MSPEIPDKGAVLTRLSLWWFDQLSDLVPNHVVSDRRARCRGRASGARAQARHAQGRGHRPRLPHRGRSRGVPREGLRLGESSLPEGLVDGSKLPEPVFTPTTKAPVGEHDLPMSPDEVEAELGAEVAAEVSRLTRAILARGNEIAAERGILIADTKVEFGCRADGTGGLVLADEVLTPDSSRFWPADLWEPGHPQPSYDKQFVRDWLTSAESGWDRRAGGPPPELPGPRRRADAREVRRGLRAPHRRDLLTGDAPRLGASAQPQRARIARLLSLWALVYRRTCDDGGRRRLGRSMRGSGSYASSITCATARFPVVEVDGVLVATAIGTLEIGVPNP